MIPFQLHRRIPLVPRPFYQRDQIAAERDVLQARLGAAERELSMLRNNECTSESVTVSPGGSTENAAEIVERFWDSHLEVGETPNSVWWLSPIVIRHINRIVCGEPIDGLHADFHRRIGLAMNGYPRPRCALSVGCGLGTKEMDVLAAGIVDTFDCYDVSGAAINMGKQIAVDRGLAERVAFHHGDPFLLQNQARFRSCILEQCAASHVERALCG
jgi:hypothetical protein